MDGSSQAQGGSAGIVLKTSDGLAIEQAIKLDFVVSSNEVEDEAAILGLRVAKSLSIATIELRCDSQLVATVAGEYEVKNKMMEQYMRIAKPLLAGFERVQIMHVPGSKNQMADALVNLATSAWYPCNMGLSVTDQSSILGTVVTAIDHQAEQSWMTPSQSI